MVRNIEKYKDKDKDKDKDKVEDEDKDKDKEKGTILGGFEERFHLRRYRNSETVG
jgi:hypothetical protein